MADVENETIAKVILSVVAAIVAGALGVLVFLLIPQAFGNGLAGLLGVLLTLVAVALAVKVVGSLLSTWFADYNVAEVAVDSVITRDGGGRRFPPSAPTVPSADEIVEQIERADEDDNVEALMLKLNTPGGEVVPSDDIRLAAAEFDGPTKAFTTDLCASGGMWIAAGCDELWARDASLVGSIGVRFSQTRFDEFADQYGINYERIVSGDYKDALGAPFKPLEDDEREYLQGLSDAWYDNFVERVAESFEMDEAAVRETEARVYLGEDAVEFGLVDELGTDDDVEERLEDELGTPVSRKTFQPERGLRERLQSGTQSLAYAAGAGVASVFAGDDGLEL